MAVAPVQTDPVNDLLDQAYGPKTQPQVQASPQVDDLLNQAYGAPGSPVADAWARKRATNLAAQTRQTEISKPNDQPLNITSAMEPPVPLEQSQPSWREQTMNVIKGSPGLAEGGLKTAAGTFFRGLGKLPSVAQSVIAPVLGVTHEPAPYNTLTGYGQGITTQGQKAYEQALPPNPPMGEQTAGQVIAGVAGLPFAAAPYVIGGGVAKTIPLIEAAPAWLQSMGVMAGGGAFQAEPGQEGQEALKGAALGPVLHEAGQIANPLLRVGAGAATMGGATALSGGSPSEIASSSILGGALTAPGGEKAPKNVEQVPEAPIEQPQVPIEKYLKPEAAAKYQETKDLLLQAQGYQAIRQGFEAQPNASGEPTKDFESNFGPLEDAANGAKLIPTNAEIGKDLSKEAATRPTVDLTPALTAARSASEMKDQLKQAIKLLPPPEPADMTPDEFLKTLDDQANLIMASRRLDASAKGLAEGKPIGTSVEQPKAPIELGGPTSIEDLLAQAEKRVRQAGAKLATVSGVQPELKLAASVLKAADTPPIQEDLQNESLLDQNPIGFGEKPPSMTRVYSGLPPESIKAAADLVQSWLIPRGGKFSHDYDLSEAPGGVQKLVASIAAGAPELKEGSSPASRTAPALMRADQGLMTPERMATTLDGDPSGRGVAAQALFHNMLDGHEVKNRLQKASREFLEDALNKAGLTDGNTRLNLSGVYGGANAPKIPVEFSGGKLNLTQAELLSMYAHLDDDNTYKSIAGSSKTPGAPINLKTDLNNPIKLTPDDMATIQQQVESKPGLEGLISDLKAHMGVIYKDGIAKIKEAFPENERIQALPDEPTPGYFVRQRNLEQAVPEAVPEAEPKDIAGVVARDLENSGIIQPRTGSKLPIITGDFFQEFHDYVDKMSSIVGLAKPISEADQLVNHPASRLAIERVHGQDMLNNLNSYLQREISPDLTPQSGLEKFSRTLNRNVTSAVISKSPSAMVMNLGGAPIRAMAEIPLKYFVPSLKNAFSSEVEQDMFKNNATLWDRYKGGGFSYALSPSLGKTSPALGEMSPWDITKRGVTSLLKGNLGDAYGSALSFVDAFPLLQKAELPAARITWSATRLQAATEHPEWSQQQQIDWATHRTNEIFAKTEHSVSNVDTSNFARNNSKNMLGSKLTLFQSDANKMYNLARQAMQNPDRVQAAKSLTAIALNQAWVTGVRVAFKYGPAVAAAWLAGNKLDEKKYPDLGTEAKWQAGKSFLSLVYGGGEALDAMRAAISKGQADNSLDSAPMQVLTDMYNGVMGVVAGSTHFGEPLKSGPNAGKDKGWGEVARGGAKLLPALAESIGVPVMPAWRVGEKAYDQVEAKPSGSGGVVGRNSRETQRPSRTATKR